DQLSSSVSTQSEVSLKTLPSLQKTPVFGAGTSSSKAVNLANLNHHVNFLAIHSSLLYAAVGDEINVYDITDNSLADTFNDDNAKQSTGTVKSLVFAAGKIFSAHQDGKIKVWILTDQKKHKLAATLPTLEDRMRNFIFPKNYTQIRRHRKKLSIEHYDAVSSLASFPSHHSIIASVSWDRSIKIWRGEENRCLESINRAHDDAINAVAISREGLIYTGSADRRIKVWKKEAKNYALIATLEKHKSAVNALALNPNDTVLFSGSCDRSVLVWEREDNANHMAATGALRGHTKAILCLISFNDLLMSGSADRTIRIWRRGFDGRYCWLAVLDGHQSPVKTLAAIAADGSVKIFSGGFGGEIKVWQVEV
ncbi:hypothetical protein M569_10613, partial [Genlisea aurea]